LLPIRYVICIFINKQVDIYSLAKLQIVIFKHQEVYFQTLGSLKSAWQRMLKHALSSSPFARKHYKQVDTG
ncbi:hypothetical protein AAH080_16970, partial [Bacteroides thetaiotaomicron]|uniref:hypothetical protein n=1 Tax=Bacteroides thetaiotaomicron TaxID=818 RepID=UPI0039B62B7A